MSGEVETWLPIAGFEGYEVSDLGRVRTWNTKGKRKRAHPYVLNLKPRKRDGYIVVALWKSGKQHWEYLQRLVLRAHAGEPAAGHEARHVNDNNRSNCALSNLCWGTRSENSYDTIRHGYRPYVPPERRMRGTMYPRAKLTNEKAMEIFRSPLPQREIGRQYGVSQRLVGLIKMKKKWAHIHRMEAA